MPSKPIDEPTRPAKGYRARDVITGVFVASLLISNVITVKPVSFFGWPIDAGTMLFPVTYIFGDILTEVYGYAQARRTIWIGLGCNLLLAGCAALAVHLPADPSWGQQEAYAAILGNTPRIVGASALAYWCGEFANSAVLAKLKVKTRGRFLWIRTIGSTVVGQSIDSGVFVFAAFWGVWEPGLVVQVFYANVVLKTAYEALATPFTYLLVGYLKRLEGLDPLDRDTSLSPFRWRG
ncbi:MAG: queuosine precursor transporter [Armatimonadia bacterium]|nr:queuosine precursor transporter [Armatimonadia bacterium]